MSDGYIAEYDDSEDEPSDYDGMGIADLSAWDFAKNVDELFTKPVSADEVDKVLEYSADMIRNFCVEEIEEKTIHLLLRHSMYLQECLSHAFTRLAAAELRIQFLESPRKNL